MRTTVINRWILFCSLFLACQLPVLALNDISYVSHQKQPGAFALIRAGKVAPIVYSTKDFAGVIRAVKHLQSDLQQVSGASSVTLTDKLPKGTPVLIVGTIGKNDLIDELIKTKKIDVSAVRGKWEASLTQVVDKPFKGIDQALVIAGSDKRGTIFGIYELSAQSGVSPWYWWADVPVKKHADLYIKPMVHVDAPAVKYRGIFINDEAPALSSWARKTFGGFNHKFYERVFELILRLKGNYLWPAMWGSAIYDDDPQSPVLADEMGVVIGTSHHEPMMRAHDEWRRYGKGTPWNYTTNAEALREFWAEGIRRMGTMESTVTVGMRGDGDEPMSEESNIELLEKIVRDQRSIIADVTGKPAHETPQLWALYKEVQEYYDKGMRVPEDITLLLCDDNWGNIRKLPAPGADPRKGGYGIYYHFDYVGGPRNYKWLNTNPISKVWEQMHLAREFGADQLWLVNVGDIKPMEFPTEFFLDYGWNPEKWSSGRLREYTERWAAREFGDSFAKEIAHIITTYTRYNGRRKPELLSPDTYSLIHYREFERVVFEYNDLLRQAEELGATLPPAYRDAYFQLVLHPVKACANLNELYYTVAKNRLYARQGRAAANGLAGRAWDLFRKDAAITREYNEEIANGKWAHMMDQTHIGYTYWQQPETNVMPAVDSIALSDAAGWGVAIEGSDEVWTEGRTAELRVDARKPVSPYFEVFNRGTRAFSCHIASPVSWLSLSSSNPAIEEEERVWVSIDWPAVPAGRHQVPVSVRAGSREVLVNVVVNNSAQAVTSGLRDAYGYLAMEASQFSRAVGSEQVSWKVIPDYGRTLAGLSTFPVTQASSILNANAPRLEYDIDFEHAGEINVRIHVSPSLDFHDLGGLKFAVSVDDEEPQVINLHADKSERAWEKTVAENINILSSKHQLKKPGKHTLKLWRIDRGVVFQKIVIDTGGLKASYLGPPAG